MLIKKPEYMRHRRLKGQGTSVGWEPKCIRTNTRTASPLIVSGDVSKFAIRPNCHFEGNPNGLRLAQDNKMLIGNIYIQTVSHEAALIKNYIRCQKWWIRRKCDMLYLCSFQRWTLNEIRYSKFDWTLWNNTFANDFIPTSVILMLLHAT